MYGLIANPFWGKRARDKEKREQLFAGVQYYGDIVHKVSLNKICYKYEMKELG